jgi:Zn-dependent protease
MTQGVAYGCPRCGNYLVYGQLACPRCGALVYADRLQGLSNEAVRLERVDPAAAAVTWRQCLDLLPPDAQQYRVIVERLRMLEGRAPAAAALDVEPPATPRSDTWSAALLKTGGSMLLSIAIYSAYSGWEFATGLVLLILVHELGHVLAMRYYGLSASPPIFIPFMGAVINLRQQPRNALEEAVVGMGGPLLGTVGALACLAWFLATGHPLALVLTFFGAILNFFNLLPVPPLDGGRITAAVSPWLWMPGILALAAMIVLQWQATGRPSILLMLLLLFAWPRVVQTLKGQARHGEYYRIGRRASWAVGAAYVALGALLLGVLVWARPLLGSGALLDL